MIFLELQTQNLQFGSLTSDRVTDLLIWQFAAQIGFNNSTIILDQRFLQNTVTVFFAISKKFKETPNDHKLFLPLHLRV